MKITKFVKKGRYLTLLAIFALFAAPSLAETRNNEKFSLGAIGGLVSASQNLGTAFEYGAKFSVPLVQDLSWGGYFSHFNKSLLNTNVNVSVVAPEITLHLDNYLPGLGFGGKMGLELVGAPNGSDGTYFVIGPHVLYDYRLSDLWTIGAEVSVLLPFSDTAATLGNFLGTIKLWF